MRHLLHWILSFAVCIAIMLAIRAYAFTIFTVPNNALQPKLKQGDRIIVNRLLWQDIEVGDMVLLNKPPFVLCKIAALPGDTIRYQGQTYLIPATCHPQCHCAKCYYCLVKMGQQQTLIQRGDIIGKAYFLFRWKQ